MFSLMYGTVGLTAFDQRDQQTAIIPTDKDGLAEESAPREAVKALGERENYAPGRPKYIPIDTGMGELGSLGQLTRSVVTNGATRCPDGYKLIGTGGKLHPYQCVQATVPSIPTYGIPPQCPPGYAMVGLRCYDRSKIIQHHTSQLEPPPGVQAPGKGNGAGAVAMKKILPVAALLGGIALVVLIARRR
jgi:hypothetical protein